MLDQHLQLALTFTATPLPAPISKIEDLFSKFEKIFSYLYGIFLGLAVVMILWAAFLYLTAGGNDSQVGNAKKTLLYAVVALVVAFFANSIPLIINSFLGGGSGGGGGGNGCLPGLC